MDKMNAMEETLLVLRHEIEVLRKDIHDSKLQWAEHVNNNTAAVAKVGTLIIDFTKELTKIKEWQRTVEAMYPTIKDDA